ncbi:MAG: copper-binding protein [Pyrinomonadaceae bacterium]
MNSSLSRPVVVLLTWLTSVLLATFSVSCGGRTPEGQTAGPTPQPGQAAASPVPWKTIEPPAQVGIPAGSPKPPEPAVNRTYSGVGVIRAINLDEGWFEIDHEDIEGVMPAMRMIWRVKEKALLKSVSAGDKVRFKVVDNNGSEFVTELAKTPNGG